MNDSAVFYLLLIPQGYLDLKVLKLAGETETAYPASVMNNAEISFVPQLSGFLKLGMGSLLLNDFLHKALVSGFWKPAFLIQQSQHSWGVCLGTR